MGKAEAQELAELLYYYISPKRQLEEAQIKDVVAGWSRGLQDSPPVPIVGWDQEIRADRE